MNTEEKKKSDELECGKAYWLVVVFFSRKLHSLVDANISDFWVT